MAYSLNKLKEELVAKGMAEDGLVGWGQNNHIGGVFAAMLSKMHCISKVGNRLVVIPFSNKEIDFSQAVGFSRDYITSAKVSGMLTGTLKLSLADGTSYTFNIMQGKNDVKEILKRLGL